MSNMMRLQDRVIKRKPNPRYWDFIHTTTSKITEHDENMMRTNNMDDSTGDDIIIRAFKFDMIQYGLNMQLEAFRQQGQNATKKNNKNYIIYKLLSQWIHLMQY